MIGTDVHCFTGARQSGKGSQLSPSSINHSGTSVSGEGNRRSGVALAMRHRQ